MSTHTKTKASPGGHSGFSGDPLDRDGMRDGGSRTPRRSAFRCNRR